MREPADIIASAIRATRSSAPIIQAEAAMAELAAHGLVIVPREPTEAMIMATQGDFSAPGSRLVALGIYRAMIAAREAKTNG